MPIEQHRPPNRCDACHRLLPEPVAVEARQVFDIPPLRHEVTEHQVFEARCPSGKLHRGEFPAGVSAPVSYGPRIQAAVLHLTHHPMLPLARSGALTGDLFGLLFSNNIAEQAMRIPKVKQKVSGGVPTSTALETFCTLRSYLATLHKQDANLYDALILTFQGQPPQPRFF